MPPPTGSPGPYVFLSYASADRERALHLADLLETHGIRVWLDRKSIAGGTSWSAEIVRGIKGCAALAIACSPPAAASPNVQQEIQLAWENQAAVAVGHRPAPGRSPLSGNDEDERRMQILGDPARGHLFQSPKSSRGHPDVLGLTRSQSHPFLRTTRPIELPILSLDAYVPRIVSRHSRLVGSWSTHPSSATIGCA
jgi:hypothetical protein